MMLGSKQILKGLCLVGLLLGAMTPQESVDRPSGEWALQQAPPPPDRPQAHGDQWWELRFERGQREFASQKPGAKAGLRRVYWHINDYRRIGGSLPRGKVIGIDMSKIETFTYPLFWSGRDWVTEVELKKSNPQIYAKLFEMALKQHRAVRRIQIQEGLILDIFRRKSEIADLESKRNVSHFSPEKITALEKRLKHLNKLVQHDQALLKNPPAPQDIPPSLVRSLTAANEILKTQTRLSRETTTLNKLRSQNPQNPAKVAFLSQYISLLQETLLKLERLHKKVQEQHLDLDL